MTDFDPVPDGYGVYRTFGTMRVTRSPDGKSVGVQFAGGGDKLKAERILVEEGFWCLANHWRREDDRSPRKNLADVVRLVRELSMLAGEK
jgi:hypothetical protein